MGCGGSTAKVESTSAPVAGKKKERMELISKQEEVPGHVRFRFRTHDLSPIRVPAGHNMLFHIPAGKNEETICRPYCPVVPIIGTDDPAFLEFIIKIYPPPNGTVSQYLNRMKIGEKIEYEGPSGYHSYGGHGHFDGAGISYHFDHVSFVCGGTGITPVYQILRAALNDAKDKTPFQLLYSCHTPSDFLLKKELDDMANAHPTRLKVAYTASRRSDVEWASWKHGVGRINEDMVREHLHAAGAKTGVVMCGPSPFTETVTTILKSVGHVPKNILEL